MVLKEQGTKEREGSKNAMKQKEKYFFDKNEVIGNKKRAIKTLNELLEAHIKKAPEDSTTENDSHLKKVNLLSYWINTYCRFIKKEKTFDASKNKVYKSSPIGEFFLCCIMMFEKRYGENSVEKKLSRDMLS